MSDRQRVVLAAIGRKPDVTVSYVALVCREHVADWSAAHDVVAGLVSLRLARWCLSGTAVQLTDAGRELLGGVR